MWDFELFPYCLYSGPYIGIGIDILNTTCLVGQGIGVWKLNSFPHGIAFVWRKPKTIRRQHPLYRSESRHPLPHILFNRSQATHASRFAQPASAQPL
jgi:hypothetical protein